jgi:hypothetical protein
MLEFKLDLPALPTATGFRRWMYDLVRKIRMACKDATPVDTGEARSSWTIVRRTEGGYSFGNITPYAHILEEGSQPGKAPWPNVGPRTQFFEGRIYSSQAVGGIFKNAEIDTLIDDAVKELERKFSK